MNPAAHSTSARATGAQRLGALIGALACLAVILMAAWVNPDPRGHGTHEQFGWAPCGILAATGRPCFTCGMTTSFAHAAHGQFWSSLRTQPMAFVMVVSTAAAFWGCLHVALTGSRLGAVASRLLRPRWMWLAAGLWGVSWVYTLLTW